MHGYAPEYCLAHCSHGSYTCAQYSCVYSIHNITDTGIHMHCNSFATGAWKPEKCACSVKYSFYRHGNVSYTETGKCSLPMLPLTCEDA